MTRIPQFITAEQLAVKLCTSPRAIRVAARRGKIPGRMKVGARVLFREDLVLEWLTQKSCAIAKG